VIQPLGPSGPPPGAPGGTQKKPTIVLAVLVGVLAAATAVFVILFLLEKGAISDTNGQVSSTEQQISGEKDKLSDVKAQVDTLEQEGQDLQTTHDDFKSCYDAAKTALDLGGSGASDAELQAAIDKMQAECPRGIGT